jgi:hypothetical protein
MAELVDAYGSGPYAARCGGSSPLLGTNYSNVVIKRPLIFSGFFLPGINVAQRHNHMGIATKSCPCAATMRALVNSPTFKVLLIFSGGSKRTTPSISGASA